jgi:hypothetical protein
VVEDWLKGACFGGEKQPLKPPVLRIGPPLEQPVRRQPIGDARGCRAIDAEPRAELRPCLPVGVG